MSLVPPSASAKGSLGILPRRLLRQCGASVVAAQDAATEWRIPAPSSVAPGRLDERTSILPNMLTRHWKMGGCFREIGVSAIGPPAASMGQNLGHRRAKFARTGSHGQAVGFHDFRLFGA